MYHFRGNRPHRSDVLINDAFVNDDYYDNVPSLHVFNWKINMKNKININVATVTCRSYLQKSLVASQDAESNTDTGCHCARFSELYSIEIL